MTFPLYMPKLNKWIVSSKEDSWFFSDYKNAEDFYKMNKDK